ncbi:hypothetical protein DUI87_02367 [Hirundo rustica rustica]|uniref:Transmembrane protein 255A n=1 Tax=Hirundo rustica rustica TaxID=333673 RepID=A0A3M0L8R3_HIRRU|nr:hypothetical protein DUI87_02367 [Hirundo rustica rustica]
MKHRAGGRFGVAARGCHLHLREEGHGENGATERCQGDFGEGRNVLEQLDWRTVGAAEGKGMEKGSFNRRKRNSLYVTVTLLIVSVLILTVGLAATTRTQNVTVGGYYPGVILGFGSFLGIIGSNLIENKRQMLVASIIFISFGVIAAFCCAIVDGVFAARHIDLRPLYAGRCQYYSKSTTPPEIPSLPTLNCAVENAHPSVNYYSRPQVTSYNSYYHSTPHLPPYSTYDFQSPESRLERLANPHVGSRVRTCFCDIECVQKVMSKTVSSVLVVNKNGGDVGEDEAKKPYKYDCLYSENEKPVGEIESKRRARLWKIHVAKKRLNLLMHLLSPVVAHGTIFSCTNYFGVIFTGGVGKNGSTIAGTSVLSPFLHIGSVIALAAMIYKKSAVQLFERHPCLYILT